jgi:hypothetical protein
VLVLFPRIVVDAVIHASSRSCEKERERPGSETRIDRDRNIFSRFFFPRHMSQRKSKCIRGAWRGGPGQYVPGERNHLRSTFVSSSFETISLIRGSNSPVATLAPTLKGVRVHSGKIQRVDIDRNLRVFFYDIASKKRLRR